MTKSQGQFKLNMDGLLEVLAGSLYANPSVGLRELIQNAHDSCTRFVVEAKPENYGPRIEIEIEANTLTVHDNGSGLTYEELETYLTTIGRSYTRELRSHLELFEPEAGQELIGQFGFGFLSAFMLANEVVVETKSWQPDSEALRLMAGGGDSFTVEAGNREKRGTTIILNVRAEASFLTEAKILSQKIRQFANFLPIPIYLNGQTQPENEMKAPWKHIDQEYALRHFIEREFQMPPPLAIIPLQDHIEIVSHGDTIETPLQGFLFIPDSTITSIREYGDLHVYIRGMFITDTEQELLPPWAKFVRGLVESPFLHPTASRESVRRDENFTLVRQALGKQLSAAMHQIQQQKPQLWQRIVRGHADVMTGWAVQDDEFFNQVANILTFRTSQGEMTLPDYLKLTDGKLYYVTHEIKSLQEKVLAEGNSYPVIEAVWFAVRPFLAKFAEEHQEELELIPLDEEPTKLFKEATSNEFIDLLAASERLGIPVKVAAFEPSQIPALMIHPKDAEKWQDVHIAIENDELDPAISGLVSSFMGTRPKQEGDQGTLFLNASCPFVIQLSDPNISERNQQIAIDLLYQIARLFSGKTMTASMATDAFSSLTSAIGELIE